MVVNIYLIQYFHLDLKIFCLFLSFQLSLERYQFRSRFVVGSRILEVLQKFLIDSFHRLLSRLLWLVDAISVVLSILMMGRVIL